MIRAMARIEDYALLCSATCKRPLSSVPPARSTGFACRIRRLFAALLDTPDAGHWIVAPAAGGVCTRRRYVKDTLVLQTEWVSGDGTVRVIDFMPPRGHAPDVVRIVEGVHGSVVMRSELAVRTGGANPVGPFLAHRGSAVPVVNPAKRN